MKLFIAFPALAVLASEAIATSNSSRPKGFPYTQGPNFMLDGEPFLFAGSNAYWLPFINNPADVEQTMKEARRAGQRVIRTWAFNDQNETYTPGGLPQYGEGTPVYFQSWKDGQATINTGPNGLQVLDQIVQLAEDHDLKLIMALTNNWADYGGMDVYTVNLGGTYHDDFYRAPEIIAAFKTYVGAVVERYKDSPAIFAWELANEPRCGADGTRNLPRSPGTSCTASTLEAWYRDTASFIKSVDEHHMVTWGGEGGFLEEGATDWAYNGADGGDFYAELALPEMDFGTFHLYPDWWSKSVSWANTWVVDHGVAQQRLQKPVLFEEYGWLGPAERLANLGTVAPENETRVAVVGEWQKLSLEQGMADMYWQFGLCGLSFGCSTNDGFTIYMNNAEEATPLVFDHAQAVNAANSKIQPAL
ncbi:uncharacterized protein L3040_005088 [Drepanopeziza brunnea f. sp. 'multigermtubi']|uniref:uncharacterized protein n=1 Tax=Drepanopeziza brunnea f. sp. 'multigermtubi' TaxID=698441 RepID=UPI0023A31533|nr:hypothetical protein L3040_005088 [Drepanopeziza brunnea f. sp. 'multigermtubi']